MAEVPGQRSIRFVQRHSTPLPFGIVGLGDIDRDDAGGVPGQHRAALGRIRLELERQTPIRILFAGDDRQTQLKEGEDQATLRNLEAIPGLPVLVRFEVRNDARQPARDAERVGILGEHGPVADLFLRIVPAQPICASGRGFEGRAPRDGCRGPPF